MCAGVMELADVLDSKSSGSDTVRVRPPPPAPKKAFAYASAFFNLIRPLDDSLWFNRDNDRDFTNTVRDEISRMKWKTKRFGIFIMKSVN